MRQNSAGSNCLLGGDSIIAKDSYPHGATHTGSRSIVIPQGAEGGPKEGEARAEDRKRFEALKKRLTEHMAAKAALRRLSGKVRFTDTREGLRIDLVDEADFSMFRLGTDSLSGEARELLGAVAQLVAGVPNQVIVRGHTDALPYAAGRTMSNWLLSTARAEATRVALGEAGLAPARFARIEGVADREPYNPADRYDPKNRRMSIRLAWREGTGT